LAKASQEKGDDTPESEPEPKTKGRKKKSENSGEELIEEIANKEELSPEGDKQKEQLEIIEQFIKIQPSITQTKEKPFTPPTGDLSTIKTGEFGDNIVSETLVEILVKQGKKDKAIEVLKKLIWKFPQKKAYFAAQIEDLRK
jgi:predicted Zn-dependent protease